MGIDRAALKRQAREAMRQPRPPFWAVTLVYLLLTAWLPDLLGFFLPSSGDETGSVNLMLLFLRILTILLSVVMGFGFDLWSLWASRKLNPDLGALLEGFSITGRVIWMYLNIVLRLMLWNFFLSSCLLMFSLLLLFPLIQASPALIYTVYWIDAFLVIAAFWVLSLRYALAPFLLADYPDDGAVPAISRSVALMRGWLWPLLKLELSFAGWFLLSFLLAQGPYGFFLWRSGFFSLLQQGDWLTAFSLYQSLAVWPVTALLSRLTALPLALWFEPYHTVTLASFYTARRQAQKHTAPPL